MVQILMRKSIMVSGVGRDRFFSRQDNSRQKQNLEIRDKKNRDSHFAGKTRQEFQVVKNFSSRQVKKISFSKISRQDKTRQDSCQEKSRKIQEKFHFCLI